MGESHLGVVASQAGRAVSLLENERQNVKAPPGVKDWTRTEESEETALEAWVVFTAGHRGKDRKELNLEESS